MPHSPPADKIADAGAAHWVYRAPEWMRPYLQLMRADRPIGWVLLLAPCWQGVALAAGGDGWRWADAWLFVGFWIGAIVMRGAGCTLNDIVDREFDAKVARTRSRPIPSGRVSVAQAAAFMLAQALIGLLVLLTLNRFAQVVCLASLVLVVIYPFMKRFTHWPQFFLGLAFNWGALVGFAAHAGGLGWAAVLLYAGGICWTIGYDTIYAHMDKDDDIEIGVKSTALLFGERTHLIVGLFYAAAWGLAVAAGSFITPWFWLLALPYAAHLAWQIRSLDTADHPGCLRLFKSNREAGALLLAALVVAGLL